MDSDDSELGTGVMRSSLAEYVFHILYQSDDVEKAIPSVLEIVGRHVGVSRVYIFEDSEDGTYCDNTFEWCNDGIVPQIDQLQHMLEGELADYYKNFNEDGSFLLPRHPCTAPESGAGSGGARHQVHAAVCDPRRRQAQGLHRL